VPARIPKAHNCDMGPVDCGALFDEPASDMRVKNVNDGMVANCRRDPVWLKREHRVCSLRNTKANSGEKVAAANFELCCRHGCCRYGCCGLGLRKIC